MPTGYTSMLDDDPQMTTKQWIMQGLARAFGMCVALRENGALGELNEEQIKQRIMKAGQRDIDWHQTELNKAIENTKILEARNEEEWRVAWQKYLKLTTKQNKRAVVKAKKTKDRHTKVLRELELIFNSPKASEVTKNVVKFGIDQLSLVAIDREPLTDELMSLDEYKAHTLKDSVRNVDYHTKEIVSAKERVSERVDCYLQLKKNVESILKED